MTAPLSPAPIDSLDPMRLPATREDNRGRHQNPALLYLMGLKSPKSRVTVKSVINTVAKMVGAQDMYSINWPEMNREHVLCILNELQSREKSASLCNLYLSALKGIAKEAWLADQMDTREYKGIQTLNAAKIKREPSGRLIGGEEIQQMIDASLARSTPAGVRDAAIVAVLRGCGPRRSEVAGLKMEDHDPRGRALSVIGKGDRERVLYMPESVADLVQRWVHLRGDEPGPLFFRINRWGHMLPQAITSDGIAHIVEQVALRAGLISKTSPHDYRRTFVTELLNEGEDIGTVADMAGHADMQTTKIYDLGGKKRMKKAARKIDIFKKEDLDSE